jgi:hypothetical protein
MDMITQVYTRKRTALPVTSLLLIAALLLLPSCGTKTPKPDKPVVASKAVKSSPKPRVAKRSSKPKAAPKQKARQGDTRPRLARASTKPKIVTAPPKPKAVKPTPKPKTAKVQPDTKTKQPARIAQARAAANPCDMADPGYGIYHPWVKNLKLGRMLMPKKGALTADNGFDLMIHFHGGNAIRKAIADTARGAFVVGVDLGAGSAAYERPFKNPRVFLNLLKEAEREVARYTRKPDAHIRRLALTGWSAGYGAIRAILRQKAGKQVDAVVLLDGLHSNYDRSNPLKLRASQLRPFVKFAKNAARGEKFMFVSHSSIVPPGYASTTETSHYLTKKLGIGINRSSAKDSPHLSRYEEAKSGGFLMRGYRGKGKADHCAQIGLITTMAATLEQQWDTPLAKGKDYRRPKPGTRHARTHPKRPPLAKGKNKKRSKSASSARSNTIWDAA